MLALPLLNVVSSTVDGLLLDFTRRFINLISFFFTTGSLLPFQVLISSLYLYFFIYLLVYFDQAVSIQQNQLLYMSRVAVIIGAN